MRLVILICGLLLSGEATGIVRGKANKSLAESIQLTQKDIRNFCPTIQRKTTLEAGIIGAKYFKKSYKEVFEQELELFGKDVILKCIAATCGPEAITSLSKAIAKYDQNGTLEGMKDAISAIGSDVARKLFQYTYNLTGLETGEVFLYLYPRARLVAKLKNIDWTLTMKDKESIGVYTWIVLYRSS